MQKLNSFQSKLYFKQKGICPVCENELENESENLEVHHILAESKGGSFTLNNLMLLHKTCHENVTNTNDTKLLSKYINKGIIK